MQSKYRKIENIASDRYIVIENEFLGIKDQKQIYTNLQLIVQDPNDLHYWLTSES